MARRTGFDASDPAVFSPWHGCSSGEGESYEFAAHVHDMSKSNPQLGAVAGGLFVAACRRGMHNDQLTTRRGGRSNVQVHSALVGGSVTAATMQSHGLAVTS